MKYERADFILQPLFSKLYCHNFEKRSQKLRKNILFMRFMR